MRQARSLRCSNDLCRIQHCRYCHWYLGNDPCAVVAGQMKADPKMSEADFKDILISVARRYGWLVHHDLPAQNSRGRWATHVQGDAGFPDLILLHPNSGKLFAIELKSEKGKTSPGQKRWLMAFEKSGIYNAVLKPSDMEYALYLLTNHQITG